MRVTGINACRSRKGVNNCRKKTRKIPKLVSKGVARKNIQVPREKLQFNSYNSKNEFYDNFYIGVQSCAQIMRKNDQFYRKVAFLMYSERVNFRPQSWKEASKLKPHRGLGTRLPSP